VENLTKFNVLTLPEMAPPFVLCCVLRKLRIKIVYIRMTKIVVDHNSLGIGVEILFNTNLALNSM
jgi:hypothetical protein